jgi:hypothetical protein
MDIEAENIARITPGEWATEHGLDVTTSAR